jgi:hypothetical protein
MKNLKTKKAFTIIEVMLVVSISGLMLVTMLVGWNANIERQRYNDSVNTFKSDIQGVFSDVENQTNDKNQRINCNTNGANISISSNNGGASTGASDCVILGKYISFFDGRVIVGNENATIGQSSYQVYDVIGRDININRDCNGPCNNNIDALRATRFVLDGGVNQINGPKNMELQWRAQFKNVTDNRVVSGNTRRFSGNAPIANIFAGTTWHPLDTVTGILILRSPLDNSIAVFGTSGTIQNGSLNNQGVISAFRDMSINPGWAVTDRRTVNICIRPANADGNRWWSGGFNFFGDRNKIVKIGPSASSVEIAPLDGPNGSSCGSDFNGRSQFSDVIIDGVHL